MAKPVIKLTPCPFCGAKPKVWCNEVFHPGHRFLSIVSCSCDPHPCVTTFSSELTDPDDREATIKLASIKWNLRAKQSAAPKLIAADLQALYDKVKTMKHFGSSERIGKAPVLASIKLLINKFKNGKAHTANSKRAGSSQG